MPSHPSTNFEIQKYDQNEPRFNGVYFTYNLLECSSTEIKHRACVINLDANSDIGTHWIVFYALNNDFTYFDSFGAEHILKEIKKFINKSTIATNIFWMQAYDSII